MCAAAALVMLAAFAVAEDGPPPVSEAAMEASCRSNLSTLATALAMYRAREGVYPDSLQQLNGMGGISSSTPFHDLACPSCGERYEYGVEGDGFTLACPAEEPHGEVIDGAFNW
jgi:hypothetical protein